MEELFLFKNRRSYLVIYAHGLTLKRQSKKMNNPVNAAFHSWKEGKAPFTLPGNPRKWERTEKEHQSCLHRKETSSLGKRVIQILSDGIIRGDLSVIQIGPHHQNKSPSTT